MATQSQINGYVQKVTQPNQNLDKNNILQGYNNFLAKQNKPAKATTMQATPMAAQTAQATPVVQNNQFAQPMTRTNQTLDKIQSFINAQPYQFSQPGQFEFNQETDPGYIAAMQSARANIQQQQGDTNAMLRAGGQGRSSYSESVANQIGAKEMARVSTDVLPQIINQAWQRYQDNENRRFQIEQANYGVTQDQIANLANLYSLQNQQDFTNPLAESQVTGRYLSGDAKQYIDGILALKAQAEAPGSTPEQRRALSAQADVLRSQLQSLGVDSSQFGANINRNAALQNVGGAGVQTLAGQAQSYNQTADQRNFDRGVLEDERNFGRSVEVDNRNYERSVLENDRNYEFQKGQQEWENNFKSDQFSWQKAQTAWENTFKEKSFQQSVQEAAASRGLQWASLNQRQKEFVADQAFREKQFQLELDKFAATNQTAAGLTAEDRSAEASAMLAGLRSGQITPSAALAQIADDQKAGVYSADDATYLKSLIEDSARTAPSRDTATPEAMKAAEQTMPSNDKIDAEAKRLGYPTLDYRSWYKSAQGKAAGLDYETWKSLYGPQLKAR